MLWRIDNNSVTICLLDIPICWLLNRVLMSESPYTLRGQNRSDLVSFRYISVFEDRNVSKTNNSSLDCVIFWSKRFREWSNIEEINKWLTLFSGSMTLLWRGCLYPQLTVPWRYFWKGSSRILYLTLLLLTWREN